METPLPTNHLQQTLLERSNGLTTRAQQLEQEAQQRYYHALGVAKRMRAEANELLSLFATPPTAQPAPAKEPAKATKAKGGKR